MLERVRLSDAARDELLDLYAACLAQGTTRDDPPAGVPIPLTAAHLTVRNAAGRDVVVVSDSGRLTLVGRSLVIHESARRGEVGGDDGLEGADHGIAAAGGRR